MGEGHEVGAVGGTAGITPVWLVGMMGVGKSTVGRHLAQLLALEFVDADHEIEERAGATIPRLFEREGEAGFRARERDAIAELAERSAVVALGGGAVAQPAVRACIAAHGTSVYLRADVPTLLRRVGRGRGRPLLSGLDASSRERRLRELLAERRAHYEAARLTVDCEGLTSPEVARRVAAALAELQRDARAGRSGGQDPPGGSAPPAARR